MTHNDLVHYLKERGWLFDWEGNKFMTYIPPKAVGMLDDFKLYIPKDEKIPDYQEVLDDTIDFVARIYDIDSSEISINGQSDAVDILEEEVVKTI